jgi:hypothetical protein
MKKFPENFLLQNDLFYLKGKYSLLIIVYCIFFLRFEAQVMHYANYVNNGSFETIAYPTVQPNVNSATNWGPPDSIKYGYLLYSLTSTISAWSLPYTSVGFQYPKSGNNLILTEFYCEPNTCNFYMSRGYPRNRLKKRLKSNITYCAKYHVVNTNNTPLAIDSYGAYFGDGSIDTMKYCTMPIVYLTPQIQNTTGNVITDTMNWVPITGTFVANGTEKYMVLGNFKSDAATNTLLINPTYLPAHNTDLFIDDVSLIEMDLPAFAGRDTSVIPGDSIYLGYEQDIEINESCIWYKLPDMTTAIDTIAGFWLKPVNNSTFVVRQQLWCSGVKWDTVVIQMNPLGLNEKLRIKNEELKIYPVPAKDYIEVSANSIAVDDFNSVKIYNHLDQLIREEEINFENGKAEIKTNELPEGIYFLRLASNSSGTVSKRFVIER